MVTRVEDVDVHVVSLAGLGEQAIFGRQERNVGVLAGPEQLAVGQVQRIDAALGVGEEPDLAGRIGDAAARQKARRDRPSLFLLGKQASMDPM